MTHSPDYYEGVRAAIAALPDTFDATARHTPEMLARCEAEADAKKALVALLPDPAKVLVERWDAAKDYDWSPHEKVAALAFARWLLSEGIIDPDKSGDSDQFGVTPRMTVGGEGFGRVAIKGDLKPFTFGADVPYAQWRRVSDHAVQFLYPGGALPPADQIDAVKFLDRSGAGMHSEWLNGPFVENPLRDPDKVK